jgi:hypothetical protein
MDGLEILIPIVFCVSVVFVVLSYFTTRNRERMAMIEKGLSSEEIKAMYTRDVRRDPLSSLKWGILFVLAGMALMLGVYLHETYHVEEGIIVGMIALFVGIGAGDFCSIASKRT